MTTVRDVKHINIPEQSDERGSLFFFENKNIIPFEIKRIFLVNGNLNSLRGNHAHKECIQFMVCLSGSIELEYNDSKEKKSILLKSPKTGLLIPKMIWCRQKYLRENSSLLVLCSDLYDNKDYIRNYKEFLNLKNLD